MITGDEPPELTVGALKKQVDDALRRTAERL